MLGVWGGDWWVGMNTLGPAPDQDHLCAVAVARQDGLTKRNCRMNGVTQTSVLCKFGNINNTTCLYSSCAALANFSGHLDKSQEKLEFDWKSLNLN